MHLQIISKNIPHMFKKFIKNFRELPLSNRSMVYLMWVYWVGNIVSGIFINIYVYKINNSINDAILYNAIFYTSALVWFSVLWQIMWLLWKDIKSMYSISYALFIASFITIFLLKDTLLWAYLFWVLYAFWNGSFWNAVHTQELNNIEDKNRDFYSSSISAGDNINAIIIPSIVALIFYISSIIKFDWYVVIFFILPVIYTASFFLIKNIASYVPQKIHRSDIKNFFNLKKYKYWHLYFFVCWIIVSLYSVLIPIISIILLKNETNIWAFQWILTIISTSIVIHLSHKRNEKKRFLYLFIPSILFFLIYIMFSYFFSLTSFIVYSVLWLMLNPIFRVSQHVYDLSLMDNIKTGNSDFYPAMILREYILWIWRFLWLVLLYIVSKVLDFSNIETIKLWLVWIWICYVCIILAMRLWEKYEKNS